MGRPRLRRATVHDLNGRPYLRLLDGTQLTFAEDARQLAAFFSRHSAFAVEYDLGLFLVVREKRARGGRYWTARAYEDGQRASVYIGAQVELAQLRNAAQELRQRLGRDVQITVAPEASVVTDMRAMVADLLARETDPDRQRAAQSLAELVERSL